MSQTVCPTCNSRCVSGNSAQCCSADCVAGCFGGNEDECHVSYSFFNLSCLTTILQACSNLNNNGTCTENCPVEDIIVNGVIVKNPEFRVEAGTQCIVPPCPGKSQIFLLLMFTCFSSWSVQTGRSVSYAVPYFSSIN